MGGLGKAISAGTAASRGPDKKKPDQPKKPPSPPVKKPPQTKAGWSTARKSIESEISILKPKPKSAWSALLRLAIPVPLRPQPLQSQEEPLGGRSRMSFRWSSRMSNRMSSRVSSRNSKRESRRSRLSFPRWSRHSRASSRASRQSRQANRVHAYVDASSAPPEGEELPKRWDFQSRRSSRQSRNSQMRQSDARAGGHHIRVQTQLQAEKQTLAADDGTWRSPAAKPQAASPAPAPAHGWRGSRHEGQYVEGMHEHRVALAERRRLRLLPEVQQYVDLLWDIAAPKGAMRVALPSYIECLSSSSNLHAGHPHPR